MAVQWQEPQPEVTMLPPAERPVVTPELIDDLIKLGAGTLDLWMHLWTRAGRDGVTRTSERLIAEATGRTERWVAKAVAILRANGYLTGGYGKWIVCSPPMNKRSESEQTFNEQTVDGEQSFDPKPERTFNNGGTNVHPERTLSPHTPLSRNVNERENTPPQTPPPAQASEAIRDFFGRYPVGHKDWRAALLAWGECGCEANAAEIMAGLDRWIGSDNWSDQGGRWIPNADKFLRQEKWRIAPPPKPEATGYRSQAEINSGANRRLVL